ncbi:acyl-CoA dehydrogenase [Streptomyces sp. MNP-20]|uniref:acyl-CoA dehydrogenase n=1 Tax=Streptomyces sp. MNP-20 TaxID=2721165 RepID=UPI00155638DD|nr:acyl-CoA dehydrogenase [Streptomyces sp. MNP-20]
MNHPHPMTTSAVTTLRGLIRDKGYDLHREQLRRIFSADVFHRSARVNSHERAALTYQRMRHISDGLAARGPLVKDRTRLRAVLEWSALADPPLFYAMFLHHFATVGAVIDFGRERDDLDGPLAELASLRSIGALCMTEAGRGNSNIAVRTQAVYDPASRQFVLSTPDAAAMKFPSNVGVDGLSRLCIVTAQLIAGGKERGQFCFLVRLRNQEGPAAGVRIVPKSLTQPLALDCASVSFDAVRLPFSSWLSDSASLSESGEFHDPLEQDQRVRRTVSIMRFSWESAITALAGITRASASLAVQHAHRRRTSGPMAADLPVIRYRNQQRALFSALAGGYVAGFIAKNLPAVPLTAQHDEGALRQTYLMKVLVDRLAERVTARSRTACGAHGFYGENRFLDYQVLAHSFNAAAADNQILLLDAAYALLVGRDYTPPVDDVVPAVGRSLTEPALWSALARSRERRLFEALASSLAELPGHEGDLFAFWNSRLAPAEELAEAHAARLAVESVQASVESVTDPDLRRCLQQLCAIHFLEEVAVHDGWYLSEGLLSAQEVRHIPALLDELCQQVAPHALGLCEALDVPFEAVGAPMSRPDYAYADALKPFGSPV